MKNMYKKRSERGATLFTVILLGVILAAIGASTFLVSSQLSNRTAQERGVTAAFQVADSAAEYVRNEYLKDQKSSGQSTTVWVNLITAGTRKVTSLDNGAGTDAGLTATTADVKTNTANLISLDNRFANIYSSRGGGNVVVRSRVYASNPAGTFTIKATAVLPDGSEQTVVKGFAATSGTGAPLFAILTRNINCAFCHVKINGDTGALSIVRPGWDTKSSCTDVGYNERTGVQDAAGCTGDGAIRGKNAARGDTTIKGSMLGLQRFTDDTSTNNTQPTATLANLNGVAITDPDGGAPTVQEKYDGDKFNPVKTAGDLDGDGINNDIPPVDLAKAEQDSTGKSITVSSGGYDKPDKYAQADLTTSGLKGGMYIIPPNGTYSSDLQQKTTLSDSDKAGTLILVGTKDDPIRLPDNFYFDGDIIIKGYVSGNGNVTASRNVYIAGEVLYKNPPGTSGRGNYNDLTTSSAKDAKAREELTSKDSLRVFAGSNAIVGDYTNQKDSASYTTSTDSSSLLDNAFRQPEKYVRQQFGLDSGTAFGRPPETHYFKADSGEELNVVKDTNGTIVSIKTNSGEMVPSDNVTSKGSYDSYDPIVKPGKLQSDGTFKKSITDKEYRDILGVQNMTDPVTVRDGGAYVGSGNVVNATSPSTNTTSSPHSTSAPTTTSTVKGTGTKLITTVVETTTDTVVATTSTSTANASLTTALVTTSVQTTVKTITKTTFYDYKGRQTSSQTNTGSPVNTTVVKNTTSDITDIPGVLYGYTKDANAASKVNTLLANQIERVDGYVYANKRVAGVVRGTNMVANGGFVTKEFGILATAVESSKNGQTAPANCSTPFSTLAGKPNNYCTGLDYGTDKANNDDNKDGTGMQVNYDNRMTYYKAPLGNIPVGTVTFFRLGTSADRTF